MGFSPHRHIHGFRVCVCARCRETAPKNTCFFRWAEKQKIMSRHNVCDVIGGNRKCLHFLLPPIYSLINILTLSFASLHFLKDTFRRCASASFQLPVFFLPLPLLCPPSAAGVQKRTSDLRFWGGIFSCRCYDLRPSFSCAGASCACRLVRFLPFIDDALSRTCTCVRARPK